MGTVEQFALTAPEPKALTPMDLLQVALSKDAAIDVIERLAALQKEFMLMDAEKEFNLALNECQKEIERVAPNAQNPQTQSKYATYAALDAAIRPVYAKYGFSLSFGTEECPKPETIRVICYCSKGMHTRRYMVDMPADGKGAKGGDVMTKTHATGAAMSYGMRYLLKCIFNVAIGEHDTDGNVTNGELSESLEWIENASSPEELTKLYRQAYQKFETSPAAIRQIVAARKKKAKDFAQ